MKLVGWTSLWAVLMAGVAFAQIDMVGGSIRAGGREGKGEKSRRTCRTRTR